MNNGKHMMDIEKLIEQLSARGLSNGSSLGYHSGLFDEAATALFTLQAENEKMRDELDSVKCERDAAIKDLSELIGDIEGTRCEYGINNADTDRAFADLCGGYCANMGKLCYEEGEYFRCKNFKWRGPLKED